MVGLGFGATTGSFGTCVWATEGWMFSEIGCTVSFVTSGILEEEIDEKEVETGDERRGKTEGSAKVTPLRVVIALRSARGLGTVLLGREPEPEEEAAFICK
nr:hypothetical protein [Tanacetum cinerariifolium]